MNQEVWKPVVGYEGLYEVSNLGRIKSLVGWNGHKYVNREKIMNQSITTTGYKKIELTKDGIKKSLKVHRLVAQSFIPLIAGKTVVNHKDSNPLNNAVENLEWCTIAENNRHAAIYGNRKAMQFDANVIITLYCTEHKTLREIASMKNVSVTPIIQLLRSNGVQLRTASESREKYYINLDILACELSEGKNVKELAKKYGCPSNLISVRKYQMKKKGII